MEAHNGESQYSPDSMRPVKLEDLDDEDFDFGLTGGEVAVKDELSESYSKVAIKDETPDSFGVDGEAGPTGPHTTGKFPYLEELPKGDIADLKFALETLLKTRPNGVRHQVPAWAAVTLCMNNYILKRKRRGRFKHSWGVEDDLGLLFYADIEWSPDEYEEFSRMTLLQRIRLNCAWSAAWWCNGYTRVATLKVLEPERQLKAHKGLLFFNYEYDLRYEGGNSDLNMNALIWCSDEMVFEDIGVSSTRIAIVSLKTLGELLPYDPKRANTKTGGPWISDSFDVPGHPNPKRVSRTLYLHPKSTGCIRWLDAHGVRGPNCDLTEWLHTRLKADTQQASLQETDKLYWAGIFDRLFPGN